MPEKIPTNKRVLGRSITNCPNCGEELINMGYDKELKVSEKECADCDLTFTKKTGQRWRMSDIWDWDSD